jgi:hypothetical protein
MRQRPDREPAPRHPGQVSPRVRFLFPPLVPSSVSVGPDRILHQPVQDLMHLGRRRSHHAKVVVIDPYLPAQGYARAVRARGAVIQHSGGDRRPDLPRDRPLRPTSGHSVPFGSVRSILSPTSCGHPAAPPALPEYPADRGAFDARPPVLAAGEDLSALNLRLPAGGSGPSQRRRRRWPRNANCLLD